jgi:peptide-methionine (S)-S-oxide reductase
MISDGAGDVRDGMLLGVEAAFSQVPGVIDATVGYAGGTLADPSYQQVCTGRTGHAEVVQVEYDPARINYERLLEVFFANHDPTQLNRQGPDLGTQYRSVIFYQGEAQAEAARAAKAALQASGRPRQLRPALGRRQSSRAPCCAASGAAAGALSRTSETARSPRRAGPWCRDSRASLGWRWRRPGENPWCSEDCHPRSVRPGSAPRRSDRPL